MISMIRSFNGAVKRWNNKIEDHLGMRVEPHLLIVIATISIILVQLLLFLVLSLQEKPCQKMDSALYGLRHRAVESNTISQIYVVTPTYARAVQKAELTRLSQTLMLVPKVHWLIVEDAATPTPLVTRFISRLRIKFGFATITQLNEQTPPEFKLKYGDPSWKYPKGVWQRNRALTWMRQNSDLLDPQGVIYFADDDNTYDLEIFEEMRSTRKVAIWPVGLVGGLLVERPLVIRDLATNQSRVHGFNARWEPNRKFPVDMAGFSISVSLFLSRPEVSFSSNQRIGYIESNFLSQLIKSPAELEPKANDCNRTLVWHTRTKNPQLHLENKLKKHEIDIDTDLK